LVVFRVDGLRERINDADVGTFAESPRHLCLERIVIGVRIRAEASYVRGETRAKLRSQDAAGITAANRRRVEVLVRESADASSSDVARFGHKPGDLALQCQVVRVNVAAPEIEWHCAAGVNARRKRNYSRTDVRQGDERYSHRKGRIRSERLA